MRQGKSCCQKGHALKLCCFTEALSLIVHMGKCTVAGQNALSQLLRVSNTRFALGSGGSLSSALNSVQLADLLGETQGLAPPPSAFAVSATAQTAPCAVMSSAPVETMLPPAYRLGSLGPRAIPCSASNVQRAVPCQAWVCRLSLAVHTQRCMLTVRTHVHHATRVAPTALLLVIT